MQTWAQRAAEAVKAGYLPGNSWEGMLRRSLERTRPELVKELGSELKAYLQVQVASALDLLERLESQGTPPEAAREAALKQLLGSSP
jgi:hypothetical protein